MDMGSSTRDAAPAQQAYLDGEERPRMTGTNVGKRLRIGSQVRFTAFQKPSSIRVIGEISGWKPFTWKSGGWARL
jgi:hypothetical protein